MPDVPRSSTAKKLQPKRTAQRVAAETGRNNLTADVITQAAVQIIQKEGFSRLSMRQLAGMLDVTATAIYHHVADKDALLDFCAEYILQQIPEPDVNWDWRRRLRALILEQQRVFMRFPGIARYLLTHRASSAAALQWAEAILSILSAAGFHGPSAMRALISVSFLINPMTLIDDKAHKKRTYILNRSGVSALLRKNARKFPHVAELLPHLGGYSYENHFEVALDRLIAGLESELAQTAAASPAVSAPS